MKVHGPLMSQSASGPFARLFEFSNHREGSRAGQRRAPAQPRTLAQRSTRVLMQSLARLWSTLLQADRDTWKSTILDHTIAPYHRFLRFNAQRMTIDADLQTSSTDAPYWPASFYPPTIAGTVNTPGPIAITGVSGGFNHTIGIGGPPDHNCLHYFQVTAEHPNPHPRTRIALLPLPDPGAQTVEVRGLPAGFINVKYVASTRDARRALNIFAFGVNVLP